MATVTTTIASAMSTTAEEAAATTTGAPPQAGILEGVMPNEYMPTNPIQLFIVQAVIIVVFCRLLHYPLSLVNQPRVIAEVIGGVLLGPSVMMRIPGFQQEIFPEESMPVLNNVANLGLLLFLFLIGLEVDLRMFSSNWKVALNVGIASMLLPFALGYAIAYGLFKEFHETDESTADISFAVYGLFIGTALAITAFPVLCRILTELNILSTPVGVTVLAAGVGNDVIGWVLLALCVALVNNGSGLTALYVLLVAAAWTLFLFYVVRPPFHWMLRRTGSIQNGPTQGMISLTLLLTLTSAWFTNIIGVHAIFGAFLVGLICPHEGGFAIKVTEKIEDLVGVLFLPLYFALSGLKTDLGLLNDGKTWGYVIGVIACAFAGKIIGGTLAARSMKLVWRESFTIGCLMSCKGLVELIVLNIGLQAGILSQRTFTMFVVMALVTTVTTSPLTKWLYPPWYQRKLEQWKAGEIDWDGKTPDSDDAGVVSSQARQKNLEGKRIERVMVYLRLDSLPSLFTFISLLGEKEEERPASRDKKQESDQEQQPIIRKRPLEVHALRMLELTERASSVMKVAESEDYTRHDPVVNAFRTFSQLHDVAMSGSVVVAPEDAFGNTVLQHASNQESDFVLIPWSEDGTNTDSGSSGNDPFPSITSAGNRFADRNHLEFVNTTLTQAVCSTGVFIARGFSGGHQQQQQRTRPGMSRTISGISARSGGMRREAATLPLSDKTHHVFLPYLGGSDDRAALHFVLQLAQSPNVSATVTHLQWSEDDEEENNDHQNEDIQAPQMTEDKVKVSTEITAQDLTLLDTLRGSQPARVQFREHRIPSSSTPTAAVQAVLDLAGTVVGQAPRNAGDIVVVGRRHAKLPDPSGPMATAASSSSSAAASTHEMQRVVGSLAERVARSDLKASLLVIQAAKYERSSRD